MVNHSNEVIKCITIFKLYSLYIVSKLKFLHWLRTILLGKLSHLILYVYISNIFNKIEIITMDDPMTHTVKELFEVCNFSLLSDILNSKCVHVLLGEIFAD